MSQSLKEKLKLFHKLKKLFHLKRHHDRYYERHSKKGEFMVHTERQNQIMELLQKKHFMSVSELAGVVYVSEATVRRDIARLADAGVVKQVYGGVVLPEYRNEVVPVSLRDKENSVQKEQIAYKASKLIHDNDTIILDASSTVRRICRHILDRKNLTIITNNLRICEELKDADVSVYCTGGALMSRRECFLGHYAEEFVRGIKADAVFFSSQGISENGDITDSSEEEIALRRVMLAAAREKYFLCDASKVGRDYAFKLCNREEVTGVITEEPGEER